MITIINLCLQLGCVVCDPFIGVRGFPAIWFKNGDNAKLGKACQQAVLGINAVIERSKK